MSYTPLVQLISSSFFVMFVLFALRGQKKAFLFFLCSLFVKSVYTLPSIGISVSSLLANLPLFMLSLLAIVIWSKNDNIGFQGGSISAKKMAFIVISMILVTLYVYYVPLAGNKPLSVFLSYSMIVYMMLPLALCLLILRHSISFWFLLAHMIGMASMFILQIYTQLFPKPVVSGGVTWMPVDEGFTSEMLFYDICFGAVIVMFIITGFYAFIKSPTNTQTK